MEQATQMWTIAQAAIHHEQESTRRPSKKFKPLSSCSSSLTALVHFTRKLETISALELKSNATIETDRIHDDEDAIVSMRTPLLPSIAEAPAFSASPVTTATVAGSNNNNNKPMTVVGTATKLGMDRSSGTVIKSNKKSKTPQQQLPPPPPLPSVITTTTTSTANAVVGKSSNSSNNNNKRRVENNSNSGERPPTPPQNPKRTRRASSVSLNSNVATTTTTAPATTTHGTTKPQPAE